MADLETSSSENRTDQHTVSFSLAPKTSDQTFSICSVIYTDQETTLTEFFNTVHHFGCINNDIYVYFHNLDYDGYFILNFLEKNCNFKQTQEKISYKNISLLNLKDKYGILYNNFNLLEIRIVWNKKCIILRNSYRLCDASIQEISKELVNINENDINSGKSPSFPLVFEKNEIKFDYEKIHYYGEVISDKEILYMLNDVNVGVCVLKMFEHFGNLGISASGMAYNLCISSFQKGILSPQIIKYMLKNYFKLISDNNELSKYIKCIGKKSKTYIFTKSFSTLDFNKLDENSPEFIAQFKTVYHIVNNIEKVPTVKIDILLKSDKKWFENIILDGLKNFETNEFDIFCELKKNPVFMEYFKDNMCSDLGMTIYKFLHLMSEKVIGSNPKITVKNKDDRIIKSFNQYFENVFTPLTYKEDKELRPAYKGGLSVAVELYSNSEQHNVIGIDINSSYSYQMSTKPLPYGKPIKFTAVVPDNICISETVYEHKFSDINGNKFTFDEITKKYNLYIIKFCTDFELQSPFNPMVSSGFEFNRFRYSDTKERQLEDNEWLYMTNAEFEIFCETHNVDKEQVYIDTLWAFNSSVGVFKNFVDKLFQLKSNYRETAFYYPVKVMLNSIYGRFSMNQFKFLEQEAKVEIDKSDILKITKQDKENRYEELNKNEAIGAYLPVAIFTTSYARVQLLKASNSINSVGGHTCYFDTDSIHFTADKIKIEKGYLVINNNITKINIGSGLGEWKIEACKSVSDDGTIDGVDTGIYICSKRYIEFDGINYKNIKCSGIPKEFQEFLTAEDLKKGKTITVKGKVKSRSGIILKDISKRIELNMNAYKTSYGTILSERILSVGDEIKDMYGRKTVIEEIIYICENYDYNLDITE